MNNDIQTEDLGTNTKIAIKKKISSCIFYLLFIKTYLIIFDIFYPKRTSTWQFSIKKVKVEIEFVLFRTTQKVLKPLKKLHLSLYTCICINSKRKIDAMVLPKDFYRI